MGQPQKHPDKNVNGIPLDNWISINNTDINKQLQPCTDSFPLGKDHTLSQKWTKTVTCSVPMYLMYKEQQLNNVLAHVVWVTSPCITSLACASCVIKYENRGNRVLDKGV